MTWAHAILEIYAPESGWPETGTPADWIEKSMVSYCGGELEHLVLFAPLTYILWWKIKDAVLANFIQRALGRLLQC